MAQGLSQEKPIKVVKTPTLRGTLKPPLILVNKHGKTGKVTSFSPKNLADKCRIWLTSAVVGVPVGAVVGVPVGAVVYPVVYPEGGHSTGDAPVAPLPHYPGYHQPTHASGAHDVSAAAAVCQRSFVSSPGSFSDRHIE